MYDFYKMHRIHEKDLEKSLNRIFMIPKKRS